MDRRRFFVAAAAATAALAPKFTRAQETDAALQQYTGSISAVLGMMGWFFDEVSRLTTTSTESDYVDEEWRLDILGPFSIASAAQEYVATLDAPALFEESHGYLVDAIDSIVVAGQYMRDGVLNLNVDSINLAVQAMQEASALITQANDAMPFS